MSDIAFHGKLDEATYASAVNRAGVNQRRLVVGAIAAVLLLISVLLGIGHHGSGTTTWAGLLMLALWVIYVLRAMRVVPRRELAANKVLSGPIRGVAREDGIEIITDYTTGNYPWSVLHHYQLAGEAMLLYISPRAAHILPRSFFGSQVDWDAFVARVQANVPASVKKGGSSIVRVLVLWLVIIVGVFLVWTLLHGGH